MFNEHLTFLLFITFELCLPKSKWISFLEYTNDFPSCETLSDYHQATFNKVSVWRPKIKYFGWTIPHQNKTFLFYLKLIFIYIGDAQIHIKMKPFVFTRNLNLQRFLGDKKRYIELTNKQTNEHKTTLNPWANKNLPK